MKTEQNYCCFCLSSCSDGSIVDSDILELLKFITVHVNVSALENCTTCDNCLNKLLTANDYKTRNSSKMLMNTNVKELDSPKSIRCQMCDKILDEQEDTFQLVECVIQIDWSDFVNYLFPDQDIKSLESSQVCDSCHVSVSNIQDFLKLLYIYDRIRMKQDTDSCSDSNAKDKNLVEHKAEVKQELENLIEDIRCKNEIYLKMEYDSNEDDDQSTYLTDKVDIKEVISSGETEMNSCHEEEESKVNSQEIDYHCDKVTKEIKKCKVHNSERMVQHGIKDNTRVFKCRQCTYETYKKADFNAHMKEHNNNRHFKCSWCSKEFTKKISLNDHLLKIHNGRDRVMSKVYECDNCSYATTIRRDMLQHNRKHGIKDNSRIFKCNQCTYETYKKSNFDAHLRVYNNIRHFKCTMCSTQFINKINLNNHLLTIHNCKDNVYECDQCSYITTIEKELLQHNIKHGIKDNSLKFKCQQCTYETYNKTYFNIHVKIHEKF